MARRNLLYEAQVTAAAQTAPQIAALSEALQQARADRNSAIRAASAANAGISHAIGLAKKSVPKAYSGAQGMAAGGQSFSGAGYAAAAGAEHAVGQSALASSMSNALKELSDRRISAAAGRAYATQKALSSYEGAKAGIQSKRQNVAAQQGLLTGAALSKLTEAQAGRDFQASQQARSQSFTAGQNLLSRKNSRLNASRQLEASQLQHASDQSFQAGQNALSRRQTALGRKKSARQFNAAQKAAARGDGGVKPTSDRIYSGRSDIQTVAQVYKQEIAKGRKLHDIANDARGSKNNYDPAVVDAAADLATKGYISPNGVRKLRAVGIEPPKEWTGVPVRPHVRKRRGG